MNCFCVYAFLTFFNKKSLLSENDKQALCIFNKSIYLK